MLSVSKRKLGISSDEIVEILDLRNNFEKVEKIVDHKKYYPGWNLSAYALQPNWQVTMDAKNNLEMAAWKIFVPVFDVEP